VHEPALRGGAFVNDDARAFQAQRGRPARRRQRCGAESGINGNVLGANDAACAAWAGGEIGRRAFDGSVSPVHWAVTWRWAVKLGKGNWIYGISARSIGACCA